MALKFIDYPLDLGQYVKTATVKTHVVWHGTMGRTKYTPVNGVPGKATSSIDSWNTDSLGRVGATYLIDRNGDIYRCFDEKYWISHLGLKGTLGKYDQASVGIELANELTLIKDGGKYFAFDKISKNTEYIGPVFARKWRDWTDWARLDDAQIEAAIDLTLDICKRWNIKPKFYKPSTTLDYPNCFDKATIICHSNCRKDKADLLLEDWVWARLTKAGIDIYEK